jgi:hypothetical protein
LGRQALKPVRIHGARCSHARSVLKSERAIQVNIAIVQAFVRMREFLATHQGLAKKLAKLEQKYDSNFRLVFEAIEHLLRTAEAKQRKKMGFTKD